MLDRSPNAVEDPRAAEVLDGFTHGVARGQQGTVASHHRLKLRDLSLGAARADEVQLPVGSHMRKRTQQIIAALLAATHEASDMQQT